MRAALLCIAALVWCACSATEGELLVRNEPSDAGSGEGGTPQLGAAIRSGMSLQYQITDDLDTQVDADLFVVDLFDTDSAQVTQLHNAGRIVIAYVSVGTLESWRPDAARFPRAAAGKMLSQYPDEVWLDVRDADVRSVMQARFQRAVDKGFDGVFASTVGAYKQDSGFALTREDELGYHQFLTGAAHALRLNIGMSSDFELSRELAAEYDWAIANSCIAKDTCAAFAPLQAKGLPVFDLETDGDHAAVCEKAKSVGVEVVFKNSRYDATRSECP
jgi:hypothetical protein